MLFIILNNIPYFRNKTKLLTMVYRALRDLALDSSKTSYSFALSPYSCLEIVVGLRRRWTQEGEGHGGIFRVRSTGHLVRVKLSFMINSSSIPKLVSSHILRWEGCTRNPRHPPFVSGLYILNPAASSLGLGVVQGGGAQWPSVLVVMGSIGIQG